MKLLLVFIAGVALYLPTVRYGFVQDDRAIIAANPAAQSLGAALRAFDEPYWPSPAEAGLYRPATILSYAVDWTVSGGSPAWLHLMNGVWHGVVCVLVVLVLARWIPGAGSLGGGLVFALHPVHVEAVAGLVGRADLLAAVGMLGAVVAARQRRWALATAAAGLAMLSKEHGVVTGVVILLDDWLHGREAPRYPARFYVAVGAVTAAYLVAWWSIGGQGAGDVAAPLLGVGVPERLAVAAAAASRAARLLIWPLDLSADYGPQVIHVPAGFSLATLAGGVMIIGGPALVVWCWRRAPEVSLALAAGGLAYLPTSNLLFASGVVLAERSLYVPVLAVCAALARGVGWFESRGSRAGRAAGLLVGLLCTACVARSLARLPAWRDNRSFLLALLEEHPESYRAHASAAAVLAGLGDTTGARREYRTADSLFSRDPHLDAARAFFLLGLGDTIAAAPLVSRARRELPRERVALRAEFLLALRRGHRAAARAVADTARRWFPREAEWYLSQLQ